MSEPNKPDRALVLRIVTEEADIAGFDVAEVLGGMGTRDIREARKRAMCRIVRETGCSARGLAEVWGCDPQTVIGHAAAALVREPASYDERTKAQLCWLYPGRAPGIIAGRDVATNRDLASWRRLGRERAA